MAADTADGGMGVELSFLRQPSEENGAPAEKGTSSSRSPKLSAGYQAAVREWSTDWDRDRARELQVELAAMLFNVAAEADYLDAQRLLDPSVTDEEKRHTLQVFRWWFWVRKVRVSAVWLLIIIPFIETPVWCGKEKHVASCRDPLYHTYGWDFLSCTGCVVVELLLLAILTADVAAKLSVLGWRGFVHDKANVVITLSYVFLVGENIRQIPALPYCHWRLGNYLRIVVFFAHDRELQWELYSIILSAPEIFQIILMMAVFMLCMSWVGVVLFDDPEFQQFSSALWSLEVLLTVNNFPAIMMAGYEKNRSHCIFFIIFLIVGLYLFLQMLTSVMYHGYVMGRGATLARIDALREQHLMIAFQLLDEEGSGSLGYDILGSLLEQLEDHGWEFTAAKDFIIAAMDKDRSRGVEKKEFLYFMEALHVRKRRKFTGSRLQKSCPELWERLELSRVLEIMLGPKFQALIDASLCINVVINVVQTWPAMTGEATGVGITEGWWAHITDEFFTSVYLIEIVLKIVLMGFRRFWSSLENRFDAVATLGAVVALICTTVEQLPSSRIMRFAMLLRFLRLLRLLKRVPWFRRILQALYTIVPGAKRIFPVLFSAMLVFVHVGCDLFGGLITTDPDNEAHEKLLGTEFGQLGFHPMNFNDRIGGAVLLFACLTLNQWDVFVAAFAAVRGKVSYIFFTAWWVVGGMMCLNLTMSVVLSSFIDSWVEINEVTLLDQLLEPATPSHPREDSDPPLDIGRRLSTAIPQDIQNLRRLRMARMSIAAGMQRETE